MIGKNVRSSYVKTSISRMIALSLTQFTKKIGGYLFNCYLQCDLNVSDSLYLALLLFLSIYIAIIDYCDAHPSKIFLNNRVHKIMMEIMKIE